MTKPSTRRRAWLIASAGCTPLLVAAPAWSQDDVASQLKALRAQVEAQTRELETQKSALQTQDHLLHEQAAEIEALKAKGSEAAPPAEPPEALATFRGLGLSGLQAPGSDGAGSPAANAQPAAAQASPTPAAQTAADAAAQPAATAQPSPAPPVQTAQAQTPQTQTADAQAAPAQAPQAQPAAAQPAQAPPPPPPPPPAASPPPQPVGEAPPPSQAAAATVTQALPEFMGVLTAPGHWVIEPQFEYLHASTNELVFRGVQIVPGLQIGLIDATTAERDTLSTALDIRTGLTHRIELEVRAPFVYRHDTTTTLEQKDTSETLTETVSNSDIGDVEVIGRYQLNSSRNNSAIWIGALDVKTNTGLGPYDVTYDAFGVAQKEATGSGFWSIEPTVSVLYPTDPVVLFASVGYIYSISRDVNKQITSNVTVQHVNPGGSPVGSVGFAFALNDRFSFSLGYKHSYIRPTETQLNGVWTSSQALQIGVSTFSMSYRITPTINLSDSFEFGVTRDAPDLHILTRLSFFF